MQINALNEPPAKTHQQFKMLALFMSIILAFAGFSLPAYAEPDTSDLKVISRNHTDAWYVDTSSGIPVVLVNNGIRNQKYPANSVMFELSPLLWGDDYDIPGLENGGTVGYNTNSWEAPYYFSPGWSAPQFRENGFESLHLEFTDVTGPGRVALYGTNPLQDEGDDLFRPMLNDEQYYIEAGTKLSIHGHEHAHWFFDRAGVHQIKGIAVGIKADGSRVESEPFITTFDVKRHQSDTLGPRDDLDRTSNQAPADNPEDSSEDPSDDPKDSNPDSSTDNPSNESPEAEPQAEPEAPGILHAPAGEKVEVSFGHVDLFNVISREDQLELNVKDDRSATAIYRQAADVTMVVSEAAKVDIPASWQHIFGVSGYLLSENGEKQAEIPFPGWDTTAVSEDYEEIRLEFKAVEGPGKVFLYQSGIRPRSAGANTVISPFDSNNIVIAEGETITLKQRTHVHANWIFEKPGNYTMSVQAVGKKENSEIVSNLATYQWKVGATNPTDPQLPSTDPQLPSSEDGLKDSTSLSGDLANTQDAGAKLDNSPGANSNKTISKVKAQGMAKVPAQGMAEMSGSKLSEVSQERAKLPNTGFDAAVLIFIAGSIMLGGVLIKRSSTFWR